MSDDKAPESGSRTAVGESRNIRRVLITTGMLAVAGLYVWGNSLTNLPGASSDAKCSLSQAPSGSNPIADKLYPVLTGLWFRLNGIASKPAPKVVVVSISAPSEPLAILNNTCEARRFLGLLVRQLDREGAKAIAIDKFYSNGSCPNDWINSEFRYALSEANAQIVVGQSTHAGLHLAIYQQDCLVLDEPFDFGRNQSDPKKVLFGLTRLNDNAQKIPLRWYTFPINADAKAEVDQKPRYADQESSSLALVAAEQIQKGLVNEPKLQRFLTNRQHPLLVYPAAVAAQQVSYTASEILCSRLDVNQIPDSYPTECAEAQKSNKKIDIRDKLVVVGDHVDSDRKILPEGPVYGVDLQARYMWALLHSSYLSAVSLRWDFAIFSLLAVSLLLREFLSKPDADPFRNLIIDLGICLAFAAVGLVILFHFNTFAPSLFLAVSSAILGYLLSIPKSTAVALNEKRKKKEGGA